MIDSHVHATHVAPHAVEQQLQTARELGTQVFVEVGTTLENSREVIAFAEAHQDFYCGLAVHPSQVDTYTPETVRELDALLETSAKMVCVGECGLDYGAAAGDRAKAERQREMVRDMIGLARSHNLPLNMHCDRESARDLVDILRQQRAFEVGGMLHNFSGNLDLAREFLDVGFYVSACITFHHPRADRLRTVFRDLPLGQLVMDSDAPGAKLVRTEEGTEPYPFDMDRVSEFRMLRYIADKLAEVKGVPVADIEAVTALNARRLFHLPSSKAGADRLTAAASMNAAVGSIG